MPGPWIPQKLHWAGSSPGRDAAAGLLHLVRERVEDADHDHAVGAAVETAVHCGCDLMSAIRDSGMWEDDDASRRQRRREIPLAPTLQPFQCPAIAQLGVLAAIELVDLLLEF